MYGLERFVAGNRKISETPVTVHGLRHTWAAERYVELAAAGKTLYAVRKQVSRRLEYERHSVTGIYLAALSV